MPTAFEKLQGWHPMRLSRGMHKSNSRFRRFRYSWKAVEDHTANLTIPYIPYSHFLDSDDHNQGLPYRWYIRVAVESLHTGYFGSFGMDQRLHTIRASTKAADIRCMPPTPKDELRILEIEGTKVNHPSKFVKGANPVKRYLDF
jgi:hypothetical protein